MKSLQLFTFGLLLAFNSEAQVNQWRSYLAYNPSEFQLSGEYAYGFSYASGISYFIRQNATTGEKLILDSSENYIYGVRSDEAGNVYYFGCTTFYMLANSTLSELALPEPVYSCITDIAGIDTSDYWIAVSYYGVFHYKSGLWVNYTSGTGNLAGNYVRDIVINPINSDVWFLTGDSGLSRFDGLTWTIFNEQNSNFPNQCWAGKFDHQGNLFIATPGHFVKYDGSNVTSYTVYPSYFAPVDFDFDSADNLIYRNEYGSLVDYFNGIGYGYPFSIDYSLEFDASNRLIVSTPAGLVSINLSSDYFYLNQSTTNIHSNLIYDMYSVGGITYLATGAGFEIFDGQTWKLFSSLLFNFSGGSSSSLVPLLNGKLAIATNQSIVTFNPQNETYTDIDLSNTGYTPSAYSLLACNSTGILYIAANGVGLISYDGVNAIEYNLSNSSIPDVYFNDIFSDPFGNIWLSIPAKGITKFNGTNFTNYNSFNSGIAEDNIYHIEGDSDFLYLFTFGSGIQSFDYSSNFTSEVSSNLLPGSFLLLHGNLWYVETGGCLTKNSNGNTSSFCNPSYELESPFCWTSDINENIWFNDSNQRLFLFNENGLTSSNDISAIGSPLIYPNPSFERIAINGLPSAGMVKIELLDLLGNILISTDLKSGKMISITIPNEIESGTYVLRMMCNDNVISEKVEIIH